MLADDTADFLVAGGPMPAVRWRSAGRARHARQRRHAECLFLVSKQPGPGSQIVEELVEHRVQGVPLGNPSVGLLHVQNRVDDLAEHLVEGGGRIMVPGRAHAGTDADRRPPPAQGRATGLRHPTRATSLPLTAGSSRAASPDETPLRQQNEVLMDRAYRGRPCPGGGRTRLVQLIPTSPVATATFITRHGLALSGCAIADYKGWTITICGSQPRNHAHWNRRYGASSRRPGWLSMTHRTGRLFCASLAAAALQACPGRGGF